MLRIILFMMTNVAVLIVLSVVMAILGFNPKSILGSLLMCAGMGMIGSFISLMMSKSMAKKSFKVQVIENPENQTEKWLVDTVKRQAEMAGIKMPEVGIFANQQPNAFATGWNKDSALVAVSTGILQAMTADELEAVLGHEIGHIANGDMVTQALLQGILNTFVLFFARIVGQIVDQVLFKNKGGRMGYYACVMVLQTVFGFLASIIVSWFSRYREFRADEAGARLASKQGMINALERLKPASQRPDTLPEGTQTMAISTGKMRGLKRALFSTHPPLDVRIQALKDFEG